MINGSESIAVHFSISPFIIGFTVLAIGTSLPEMMVSVLAALKGDTGIVFGNVIGSNISNTLLIIGITALIADISFTKKSLRNQVYLTTGASLIFIFLTYSNSLSSPSIQRLGGLVLLVIFSVYLWYLIQSKAVSLEDESYPSFKMNKAITMCLLGSIALGIGGQLVVSHTLSICTLLNLESITLSLIIIALGTSLPELVTCVDAVKRGKGELAIGNILGSNIFNLYLVLGISASLAPLSVPSSLPPHLAVMFISMVMIIAIIKSKKEKYIGRVSGIILILSYTIYLFSFSL